MDGLRQRLDMNDTLEQAPRSTADRKSWRAAVSDAAEDGWKQGKATVRDSMSWTEAAGVERPAAWKWFHRSATGRAAATDRGDCLLSVDDKRCAAEWETGGCSPCGARPRSLDFYLAISSHRP